MRAAHARVECTRENPICELGLTIVYKLAMEMNGLNGQQRLGDVHIRTRFAFPADTHERAQDLIRGLSALSCRSACARPGHWTENLVKADSQRAKSHDAETDGRIVEHLHVA